MLLSLNYGRGQLTLEIPEKNLFAYHRPNLSTAASTSNNQKILLEAINEFGILRISPIFAGRQVGVIIEVSTRSTPQAELLAVLLPFLRSARSVQFLLATDGHEPDDDDTQQIIDAIQTMIADFEFPDYEIHANARGKDEFVEIGRTARGTPVQVNARSAQCDIFLVIADIQNHEFAGYTNPLRNFLPGICSLETLTKNESLARDERATFGKHPWHPDPQRRNNPLADDVWEGVQMILRRRPVLALTVIAARGLLQWAKIGALIEATSAGIQRVDELLSFALPPADYLIISSGGYPEDESFYAAQRALELTKNAIAPNGEVLFLAHCENGIGPQHFYEALTKPLPEILMSIENGDKLDSHKAYKFAQRIQQLRAIQVHSSLSHEALERMHLHVCAEPQALVNQWLAQNPQAQISVLDGAGKLAISAV